MSQYFMMPIFHIFANPNLKKPIGRMSMTWQLTLFQPGFRAGFRQSAESRCTRSDIGAHCACNNLHPPRHSAHFCIMVPVIHALCLTLLGVLCFWLYFACVSSGCPHREYTGTKVCVFQYLYTVEVNLHL